MHQNYYSLSCWLFSERLTNLLLLSKINFVLGAINDSGFLTSYVNDIIWLINTKRNPSIKQFFYTLLYTSWWYSNNINVYIAKLGAVCLLGKYHLLWFCTHLFLNVALYFIDCLCTSKAVTLILPLEFFFL